MKIYTLHLASKTDLDRRIRSVLAVYTTFLHQGIEETCGDPKIDKQGQDIIQCGD